MNTRVVSRLLAAGVLLATLAGCGAKKESADPDQAVALLGPRDVAGAVRSDLASGLPVTGTLRPVRDVQLSTPYPELIEAVLVKEGQPVKKGQPLARLRTESIAPAAASAESQRRIAAADYQRMQNLFKEGAVAQRDVDNAEAVFKAAEAMEALARKRLDEAVVRAPFDGVVAKRVRQAGDRVGDGDQLFRVVNTSELELEATVPSEAVASVKVGTPVTLTVSGLDHVTITGHIARVNATVDPATRQVQVYAAVPNRDGRLVGDLFASGRVVLSQVTGAIAVPTPGVRDGADGAPYVWVVANGKAEKRAVATGIRDEVRDLVEIRSGLREGETVVVGPVESLNPGQLIQIVGNGGPVAAGAKPASRPATTQPGSRREK
jgi:RND family efflux transporter MFP subunit